MKYTTATFAIAMSNIIPAMTFLMAWICRLEKVNIKKKHSIGKIIGTLVTVGDAMIMTVVVGPTIGLPWTKGSTTEHQNQSTTHINPGDNIKGLIMIIAACLSWSCFYIVQSLCVHGSDSLESTAGPLGSFFLNMTCFLFYLQRNNSRPFCPCCSL